MREQQGILRLIGPVNRRLLRLAEGFELHLDCICFLDCGALQLTVDAWRLYWPPGYQLKGGSGFVHKSMKNTGNCSSGNREGSPNWFACSMHARSLEYGTVAGARGARHHVLIHSQPKSLACCSRWDDLQGQ